ncbi:MAG TPA: zf-HC2 domain-containing protein [Mycobacteriales bacterium]|jgi:anti-sigma factor RsiW|nr:zf-HC2 domain-containing protein [Mycobacteriales bacterium]
MTEQHVPIEDLAAYAAGDLDAPAAVAVEAHVLLCAGCRADVDAINATAAALASVPPAPMPAEVAARVDAALAAVAPAAPVGTVLPMRRRRPSWEGIAAVAAVVLLVGGIAIGGMVQRRPVDGKAASAPGSNEERDAVAGSGSTGTRRLASGLDYTRANLAGTLAKALGGATAPAPVQLDSNAGTTGGAAPSAAPQSASEEVLTGGTSYSQPKADRLLSLQAEPARLAACLRDLGPGQVPLVVDFARWAGKPAVVIAFAHVSANGTVSNKVDVWVAGPGCGSVPGGDVLDFQRIDRPPL